MQIEMESTSVDWVGFFAAEALVTGVLSKALYGYPDRAWLQWLAEADLFTESPLGDAEPDVQQGLALLQGWTESVGHTVTSETYDALSVDYTRLFIGPDRVLAPLWESVYFNDERMVFKEQTMQVRAWYKRFGLAVSDLNHEPDDHLGLELAFLAHLARQALAAIEQQDSAGYERIVAGQRAFLAEHPLKWVRAWCELVTQHAHTDFFRGIALFTQGSLLQIKQTLEPPPKRHHGKHHQSAT